MSKLTIVVCVDQAYYEKAASFWLSLKKHWKFRVCVLCVGFKLAPDDPIGWLDGWEFASVELNNLPSYRKGWPLNRGTYFSCEGGDFLNYFEFADDDVIIQPDADMIMQRSPSLDEIDTLESIWDNEIMMSSQAYPQMNLREEFWRLKPSIGYGRIKECFPGNLGEITLLSCGVIVCQAGTYRKIFEDYLRNLDAMMWAFSHHGATQWLFNYVTKDLAKNDLGPSFHGAAWFIDTGVVDGDQLTTKDGEVVLFNHTKFNKEYKF